MPFNPHTFNPSTALPYLDPSQTRKVALVTGANSGLGWYTCLHLYVHGWTVYVGARDPVKGEKAVKEIKEEAERRRALSSSAGEQVKEAASEKDRESETFDERHRIPKNATFGTLIFFPCNLISLETTQTAIDWFLSHEKQLDLLINNAGVMGTEIDTEYDNLDVQVRVNHLAQLLLTIRLIPLLLLSPSSFGSDASSTLTCDTKVSLETEDNEKAVDEKIENDSHYPRIIFLSSIGHTFSDNPPDLSKLYSHLPNFVGTWLRYGVSKLANIHTAKALAQKYGKTGSGKGIACIAVHPGVAVHTNLFNCWTNYNGSVTGSASNAGTNSGTNSAAAGFAEKATGWVGNWFSYGISKACELGLNLTEKVMGVSVEEGCYNTLYAALSPDISPSTGSTGSTRSPGSSGSSTSTSATITSQTNDKETDSKDKSEGSGVVIPNGSYLTPVGCLTAPSAAASSSASVENTWKWSIQKFVDLGAVGEDEAEELFKLD